MNYMDIIQFWYTEITPRNWFMKDLGFDAMLKRRFSHIHQQAVSGELSSWRSKPLGQLAEIIVLDQFSRNLYRTLPQTLAYDGQALVLAQTAIAKQADVGFGWPEQKIGTFGSFLYIKDFFGDESLFGCPPAVVKAKGGGGALAK